MVSSDIKSQFGNAVRARRKRLGISQEELAGRASLHRTYVADIERGARNLSLANIEKLAKALGISIPTLFAEDPLGIAANEPVHEILLVEDDLADVERTLDAFKKACLANRIKVVKDGEEALEYIFHTGAYAQGKTAQPPEVVLLDLTLPKVTGLEVLRQMKADRRTRSIPVVVLSGEWNRDVEETKRLGAESFIMKPLDFQRFSQITPELHLCWSLIRGNGQG
jgi:CheY-like chemotaxis protein